MTTRVHKADAFADAGERVRAGRLGMWVFLASLAMLFGASVIGFIVIRTQDLAWPEVMPPLPRILWASTAILAASSATLQAALAGVQRGSAAVLRGALAVTLLLGAAFLACQTAAWWQWRGRLAESSIVEEAQAFALTAFYVLTGVHALHVIGGLVPLVIVTARAWRGRYTPAWHPGLAYCAIYWHFLDGVWLVLFLTLLLGV